ncbi:hypothetical protein Tco_0090001 [Tanacetum coccineum]
MSNSVGGSFVYSKILILVSVSPYPSSYDESLDSLLYGKLANECVIGTRHQAIQHADTSAPRSSHVGRSHAGGSVGRGFSTQKFQKDRRA